MYNPRLFHNYPKEINKLFPPTEPTGVFERELMKSTILHVDFSVERKYQQILHRFGVLHERQLFLSWVKNYYYPEDAQVLIAHMDALRQSNIFDRNMPPIELASPLREVSEAIYEFKEERIKNIEPLEEEMGLFSDQDELMVEKNNFYKKIVIKNGVKEEIANFFQWIHDAYLREVADQIMQLVQSPEEIQDVIEEFKEDRVSICCEEIQKLGVCIAPFAYNDRLVPMVFPLEVEQLLLEKSMVITSHPRRGKTSLWEYVMRKHEKQHEVIDFMYQNTDLKDIGLDECIEIIQKYTSENSVEIQTHIEERRCKEPNYSPFHYLDEILAVYNSNHNTKEKVYVLFDDILNGYGSKVTGGLIRSTSFIEEFNTFLSSIASCTYVVCTFVLHKDPMMLWKEFQDIPVVPYHGVVTFTQTEQFLDDVLGNKVYMTHEVKRVLYMLSGGRMWEFRWILSDLLQHNPSPVYSLDDIHKFLTRYVNYFSKGIEGQLTEGCFYAGIGQCWNAYESLFLGLTGQEKSVLFRLTDAPQLASVYTSDVVRELEKYGNIVRVGEKVFINGELLRRFLLYKKRFYKIS